MRAALALLLLLPALAEEGEWLARLGDPAFAVREEAQKRLTADDRPSDAELRRARAKASDPEVGLRLEAVLAGRLARKASARLHCEPGEVETAVGKAPDGLSATLCFRRRCTLLDPVEAWLSLRNDAPQPVSFRWTSAGRSEASGVARRKAGESCPTVDLAPGEECLLPTGLLARDFRREDAGEGGIHVALASLEGEGERRVVFQDLDFILEGVPGDSAALLARMTEEWKREIPAPPLCLLGSEAAVRAWVEACAARTRLALAGTLLPASALMEILDANPRAPKECWDLLETHRGEAPVVRFVLGRIARGDGRAAAFLIPERGRLDDLPGCRGLDAEEAKRLRPFLEDTRALTEALAQGAGRDLGPQDALPFAALARDAGLADPRMAAAFRAWTARLKDTRDLDDREALVKIAALARDGAMIPDLAAVLDDPRPVYSWQAEREGRSEDYAGLRLCDRAALALCPLLGLDPDALLVERSESAERLRPMEERDRAIARLKELCARPPGSPAGPPSRP